MASERRTAAFRLGIEYDGTDFHGWQIQRAERSVQGELLAALRKVCGSSDSGGMRGLVARLDGAGRTDAGCHAAGQVASVTLTTRLTAERLRLALNALLPEDVRILEADEVDHAFHARFDAMRRAYRYLIAPPPAAIRRRYVWDRRIGTGAAALNAASRPLLGEHDFTTFSKQGSETPDARCRVTRARWSGRRGRLQFDIEADRFLYSMVRRIVSTVVRAAESGAGSRAVREALEARDRRASAPPAPAHGLYLMRVRYPRVGWVPKEPLDVCA